MRRALSAFVLRRRTMADGRAAPQMAAVDDDWIPRAALEDSLARGYQLITPFGGFDSAAAPIYFEVKSRC